MHATAASVGGAFGSPAAQKDAGRPRGGKNGRDGDEENGRKLLRHYTVSGPSLYIIANIL